MEWTAEIFEKSRERDGMVKSGVGGAEFRSGLGFLRWWSLMREWNFSATSASSGDRAAIFGFSLILVSSDSSPRSEVGVEEYNLKKR